MRISAAIFDIGNVLLHFDYMKAARRLVEKNRLETLPDRVLITALNRELELGRLPEADFISAVRAEFHDRGSGADFVAIWSDIFVENLPMTGLARRLSERMPVYLLSNVGPIHYRHVFRTYPVFSVFRDGIYSFQAGLMKPDPAIYGLARTRFGVEPATTLYVDDIEENCDAARAAGFVARQYGGHPGGGPESWDIPL